MANELAAVLVPIGHVGAVIAVLCAIVAGVAIVRAAAGLAGGAVGVWVPAALLSSTASFASQWMPLVVSGAALVGMLVVGGVVRAVIGDGTRARAGEVLVEESPQTATVSSKTAAVVTAASPALAR